MRVVIDPARRTIVGVCRAREFREQIQGLRELVVTQ